MARMKLGGGITQGLGQMVGLLLGLYVFDEVLSSIAPSLWDCYTSTTTPANGSWELAGVGGVVTTNGTLQVGYCTGDGVVAEGSNASIPFFQSAISFVGNLLPVIGILGAFEIIYTTLKRSGLV